MLDTSEEDVPVRTKQILEDINDLRKELIEFRRKQAIAEFQSQLLQVTPVKGIPVLRLRISDVDVDTLRILADQFRQRHPSGVAVLGSVSPDGRPIVVAAVTDDLVKRGINAIDLVKFVAGFLGGGGGGRPTLAQAGGKDPSRFPEALDQVLDWISHKSA